MARVPHLNEVVVYHARFHSISMGEPSGITDWAISVSPIAIDWSNTCAIQMSDTGPRSRDQLVSQRWTPQTLP